MGFPSGYTEFIIPKLLINALSLLGLLRTLLLSLLSLLGLPDFLDPDPVRSDPVRFGSISASLIREILPVVKFSEIDGGDWQEKCAVCLNEFEGEEEIRRLRNCQHIFHRSCVDRWMEHERMTCPLCRTLMVPEKMMDDFSERI